MTRLMVSAPPLFSVIAVSCWLSSVCASVGSWSDSDSIYRATVSGEATSP